MQLNEPDNIKRSLFSKILIKQVIFQHKLTIDPMGRRSLEQGGINLLFQELDGEEVQQA